ncbi:2-C-methyl-D-erythritol 4-phosphate cytidylyltransferase [Gloeocapsa sp. PCC 73106]|uniref:2-C-methyl-D-erythritol 4-phosphate cytidylyltransferase n=1 Tax=Gloeocapsa sp. PCC 73106 TaxID=102232 RepID=UPI0002ABECA5|nr:2-C-methyl-D-erythritol 4-phosphate cytidylyltransferase [Gloeocapsa sp. PCC 73106]ELR99041.1 2-C-methyl-D-erythritol 4-phosphate cytidylyltransferase [Gloeocapsa sp. PCC 73106]
MYLLIPAAGSGRRMGSDRNKLLLTLHNQPLLAWTLLAADAATEITWIGVIGQPYDFEDFQRIINELAITKPVELIPGGKTRQISVSNGLESLPPTAARVLIHDGARCLATPHLFNNCAQALQTCQGLIAAIPVKDTIKIVDQEHFILDTPDRSQLWAAQTPQGFEVELLRACHRRGRQEGWEVTDDAALLEKCDIPVKIVPGEETNLKITTSMDLAIANFILSQRH